MSSHLSCPSRADHLSVFAAVSRGISPAAPSPSAFSLIKEDEISVPHDSAASTFQSVPNANEEISAADYDPSADRRAEDIRRQQNETEKADAILTGMAVEGSKPKIEEVEEEEVDDDDDDDMFSDVVKVKKVKKLVASNAPLAVPVSPPAVLVLPSSVSDPNLSPRRSSGSLPSLPLRPLRSRTTGTTRMDTTESRLEKSSTMDATKSTARLERACSRPLSRLEFSRGARTRPRESTSRLRLSGVRSQCAFCFSPPTRSTQFPRG